MPTACIHHPGSKISLESERLVVSYTDDEGAAQKRDLPLRDLERIILADCVFITSPALGLLHATENGRWSLALDLMEPFRPVLGEALTLD